MWSGSMAATLRLREDVRGDDLGRLALKARDRDLSHRVFAGDEAIVDACCKASNALFAEAGRIKSIATRAWAAKGQ